MAEIIFSVKRRMLDRAGIVANDRASAQPKAEEAPVDVAAGDGNVLPNCFLGYEPFPKQCQFHSSPAKYRLFGGAAGPGKTKALLMEAVVQALRYPNVNTLLLRRTFPELEASLSHYFRRDVPRELYVAFHESKHLLE
jgi:hypothetical protein